MSTLSSIVNDVRNGIDTSSAVPISSESLSQPSTLSFIGQDVAAASASAIPVAPTMAAPGAPFSAIYAFGDSLTDAGNDSLATAGLVPVSPPYADRSFSNGPVWVKDLAQNIGLPAIQPSLAGGTDFAYGGAQTGQTPAHTLNPTDLPSQVAQFESQVATPQAGALYAIWIGANDVLDIANNSTLTPAQQQADVAAAVNNETSAISALAAHGAQNLLVLNVPDLGKTPFEIATWRGGCAIGDVAGLALQHRTRRVTATAGSVRCAQGRSGRHVLGARPDGRQSRRARIHQRDRSGLDREPDRCEQRDAACDRLGAEPVRVLRWASPDCRGACPVGSRDRAGADGCCVVSRR